MVTRKILKTLKMILVEFSDMLESTPYWESYDKPAWETPSYDDYRRIEIERRLEKIYGNR